MSRASTSFAQSLYGRMIPDRRSLRVAARSVSQASSAREEKGFSTPRNLSSISQAKIKRASEIFSDIDNFSDDVSSERGTVDDEASEEFRRRRIAPQVDAIKRRLKFNQKSASIKDEFNVNCVSSSFRVRKIRVEAKPRLEGVSLREEAMSQIEKYRGKVTPATPSIRPKVEAVVDAPQRLPTVRAVQQRNSRTTKVKLEPKLEQEVKLGGAPKRKVTRAKSTAELEDLVKQEPQVKSEAEELDDTVKQGPKLNAGSRRRKMQHVAGGEPPATKDLKKAKRSDDFDQSTPVEGSRTLAALDPSRVTTDTVKAELAFETPPLTFSVSLPYRGPYPSHARPYPEECETVKDLLANLHGHLPEYERHKKSSPTLQPATEEQEGAADSSKNSSLELVATPHKGIAVPTGHPRERRTVIDSLVGTLLSQNTTDNNSRKAFANLKKLFPTWDLVHKADPKEVEEAIRCGGLAEIKAGRILNILSTLLKERGEICMEYVRSMSNEEVKTELSRFKGVGPKTVACVLMFHLQRKEFPVDTHVFRISKALGWVPAAADREKAYLHLNQRIPDHLKFDIHCLFVTHGKRCPQCAKRHTQHPKDGECPLVGWNSKMMKCRPRPQNLLLKSQELLQLTPP